MNMWPSQLNRNLSNCEEAQKKVFRGFNGIRALGLSVLSLQCSTSWAMKTHPLRAGQFIEFINPWKEWNTEWNDVNCGNIQKKFNFSCIYVEPSTLLETSILDTVTFTWLSKPWFHIFLPGFLLLYKTLYLVTHSLASLRPCVPTRVTKIKGKR